MATPRPQQPRIRPLDAALTTGASPMKSMNVRATLANHPAVARAMAGLGTVVLTESSIGVRQRELAILRMGWNCQSVYEFGQHTLMARSIGITDAEITALTRPLSALRWAVHDRAVLEMVDQLYADDCVSDHTWHELTQWYTPPQMLELMLAPLFYRMVSGLLNSCGVAPDDGVPGWPT